MRKKIMLDLYRVYITNTPDKVPKGANVQTTPRGAKYYETDDIVRSDPGQSSFEHFTKATNPKPADFDFNTITPHLEAYTNISNQMAPLFARRKELNGQLEVLMNQLEELKRIKGNVKDRNKVRKESENIMRELDWNVNDVINKLERQKHEALKPVYDQIFNHINTGVENQPSQIMQSFSTPKDMSILQKYFPNVPDQSFEHNLAAEHLYESIEPATEWFTELTKGIPQTGPTYLYPLPPRRGFMAKNDDGTHFVLLAFSWAAGHHTFAKSCVHELGHVLEKSGNIKQQCIDFLNRRTQGEELVKLSDVTGRNYKEEMCKPDHFPDPYCGKIYDGTDATEILSMGLQYLYDDPVKFHEKDPDYFNFIINTLKGAKQ